MKFRSNRVPSLQKRFHEFDIECVDVLIGKPDTAEGAGVGKIETLLEQLRQRQLSIEQLETYDRQRAAAEKLRTPDRSAGDCGQTGGIDQLAGADPHRREPGRRRPGAVAQTGGAGSCDGRGRPGPLAPAGGADRGDRAGGEPAAHPGRQGRIDPRASGRAGRGDGAAAEASPASAIRGCTRWRRWRSICRRRPSRWFRSGCSWAARPAKDSRAGPTCWGR